MVLAAGAFRRFLGISVAGLCAVSAWAKPLRADCSTQAACARQRARAASRARRHPLESDGSTLLIVSGAVLTSAGLATAVAGTVLTLQRRGCTGLEGYQYVRTHECTSSGPVIATYFMTPLLLGSGVPLLMVGMHQRSRAAASRASISPWLGWSSFGVAYRLEL